MTTLYIGNPACIEIENLIACGSTTPITDATVEATILDSEGSPVLGQTWPLAMAYDSGTAKYRGITDANLVLTENDAYTIEVEARDGTTDDVIAKWQKPAQAAKRCE